MHLYRLSVFYIIFVSVSFKVFSLNEVLSCSYFLFPESRVFKIQIANHFTKVLEYLTKVLDRVSTPEESNTEPKCEL